MVINYNCKYITFLIMLVNVKSINVQYSSNDWTGCVSVTDGQFLLKLFDPCYDGQRTEKQSTFNNKTLNQHHDHVKDG